MFNIFRYIVSWIGTIVFALAILSVDLRDPTLFHQIVPNEGIQNWIGVFGALLGGTLVELFGVLAFWICITFFMIIAPLPQSFQSQGQVVFWSAIFMWALSALQNTLLLNQWLPSSFSLILQHSGYFGYISFYGLSNIIGWNFAIIVIGLTCLFSLYQCLSIFLMKSNG